MQNAPLWKQFEGQWVDSSYRLLKLLGAGGFGGVFLADHIIDGTHVRRVAIKLTIPDADHADRQVGELVAGTTLKHPNLVACFHAASATLPQGRVLYLVMELADQSLQTRLGNGLLAGVELLDLAEQMASALACLHLQKRVHRDVKPANILQVGGVWKLGDFGSLRASAGATTSHTEMVLGSMRYMPPESFSGIVSPAWDVWSLGVLLLEALSGKAAFAGTSQHQLMAAILHQEPAIPADLPAPYDEVLVHCLVKDYKARWSAQQLLDRLRDHRKAVEAQEAAARRERIAALKAEAQREAAAGRFPEAIGALDQVKAADPDDPDWKALAEEVERQRLAAEHFQQQMAEAVAARNYVLVGELLATLPKPGVRAEPLASPTPRIEKRARLRWILAQAAACVAIVALFWGFGVFKKPPKALSTPPSPVQPAPTQPKQSAPSVPTSPAAGPVITELQNDVQIRFEVPGDTYFKITVPAGMATLVVTLTPLDNDSDLGVHYGSIPVPRKGTPNKKTAPDAKVQPVPAASDCRSTHNGTEIDTCKIASPQAGEWFIRVWRVGPGLHTATIRARYSSGTAGAAEKRGTTPPPAPEDIPALQNDVSVRIDVSTDIYYKIAVPFFAKSLTVVLTPITDDPDLAVHHGVVPTPANLPSQKKGDPPPSGPKIDCRSGKGGQSVDSCTIDNPQSGYWFIWVKPFRGSPTATLKATVR